MNSIWKEIFDELQLNIYVTKQYKLLFILKTKFGEITTTPKFEHVD
jgi:hypothetical protein